MEQEDGIYMSRFDIRIPNILTKLLAFVGLLIIIIFIVVLLYFIYLSLFVTGVAVMNSRRSGVGTADIVSRPISYIFIVLLYISLLIGFLFSLKSIFNYLFSKNSAQQGDAPDSASPPR